MPSRTSGRRSAIDGQVRLRSKRSDCYYACYARTPARAIENLDESVRKKLASYATVEKVPSKLRRISSERWNAAAQRVLPAAARPSQTV